MHVNVKQSKTILQFENVLRMTIDLCMNNNSNVLHYNRFISSWGLLFSSFFAQLQFIFDVVPVDYIDKVH